jgi:hypothetical protein
LLHQHQTTKKMKATTIIIAAVLTLQTGILFAGNETCSAPLSSENTSITLAPTTPFEATFEEVVTLADAAMLDPTTPSEATFEEMPSEMISTGELAPVVPAEADFYETGDSTSVENGILAPATPAFADFE